MTRTAQEILSEYVDPERGGTMPREVRDAALAVLAKLAEVSAERDRQRGAAEKHYARAEDLLAQLEALQSEPRLSTEDLGGGSRDANHEKPSSDRPLGALPSQSLPRLSTEEAHPFEPCLEDEDEPGHNFTCALLCTVCGLPADKHGQRLSTEEEVRQLVDGKLVKVRDIGGTLGVKP